MAEMTADTTSEIAPFVTASSVMLGAFGFFYGSMQERIQAGRTVGTPAADPVAWRRQVAAVREARTTVRMLGGVAIVVWVLLAKAVWDELEAAWDVHFSLSHYQAFDVVFVILATAWLVIAALMFAQARRLTGTLHMLDRAKPEEA
jgi:hypothetical protein